MMYGVWELVILASGFGFFVYTAQVISCTSADLSSLEPVKTHLSWSWMKMFSFPEILFTLLSTKVYLGNNESKAGGGSLDKMNENEEHALKIWIRSGRDGLLV